MPSCNVSCQADLIEISNLKLTRKFDEKDSDKEKSGCVICVWFLFFFCLSSEYCFMRIVHLLIANATLMDVSSFFLPLSMRVASRIFEQYAYLFMRLQLICYLLNEWIILISQKFHSAKAAHFVCHFDTADKIFVLIFWHLPKKNMKFHW